MFLFFFVEKIPRTYSLEIHDEICLHFILISTAKKYFVHAIIRENSIHHFSIFPLILKNKQLKMSEISFKNRPNILSNTKRSSSCIISQKFQEAIISSQRSLRISYLVTKILCTGLFSEKVNSKVRSLNKRHSF